MTPLAWAHLPSSLYPERSAVNESAFEEWSRAWIGRMLPTLKLGIDAHRRVAERAEQLEALVSPLDDATLRARLRTAARASWNHGRQTELALALVREAAVRSLGVRPFATQLMGASCLLAGQMAEMPTGEGKTFTAGLAAAVAAVAGIPTHVITVNDYLARRDAEQLAPMFAFLGLSIGTIVSGMELGERRSSYFCDVTYCTGKELVFDYLKDRAAHDVGMNQAQLRLSRLLGAQRVPALLRGLYFGIVDEADSVLIDEARTPLILSENAGTTAATALHEQAIGLAASMKRDEHFALHRGARELHLLPAGRMWLTEQCVSLGGEWAVRCAREHWVLQALRAEHLFHRDEHYIVKDGQVLIVDENTGRALPGRTWEHGLHQIVETREGCPLSDQSRTVARITYQRYFRRYLRLAGMTGTAQEVRQELWRDYGLSTVVIPPNRPCVRRVMRTRCSPTEADKWSMCADSARYMLSMGRPVLIGTRSVGASERLSAILRQSGIAHQVLNAMQDEREAELVAQAGQSGRIMVATNMAGRGTDIKPPPVVLERGGLHVILTEFHESRRIDRQLFGRAARQGDPGSAQAIVSLEDPLFTQRARTWLKLGGPIASSSPALASPSVEVLRVMAQRSAERLHERTRRNAVKEDDRLEKSLSYSGRY